MKNASRKRKKNKLRRNQEAGADFPFETVVEVDAVRFHKDGTVDLFLEDADIPAMVSAPAMENRRPNARPKKRAKAKKRKTRR